MKFEGAVKSSELPEIFQLLSSSGRKGALVVTQGARQQRIYFSPEGVTLPFEAERSSRLLGQILLARGVINEGQLVAGLQRQRASGLPIGEILINAGAAKPEDVKEALTYQLREELFDVLTWESATFEFVENAAQPVGGRSYLRSPAFNVDAIIMEAARRADEWKRIRRMIPSGRAVLLKLTDRAPAPEDREGGEAVARLLELADGTHSLEEMLKALGRSEFDVYESAATVLGAGAAKLARPEELADLAAAALKASETDRARRLLANAAALAGDNLELRYDIGIMYLWMGSDDEAAAHLDVILGRLVEEDLPDKIDQMLDNIRDQFPDAPYGYERRLKLLDPKKDFNRALPLAQKLLEIYDLRGDTQTARRMFRWLKQFTAHKPEDLLRFGELLESCGEMNGAAQQYFLAARQLRYAVGSHDAMRLCRKAMSLDGKHVAARRELDDLLKAPRRRRRKLTATVAAGAVLFVAVFALALTAARERQAGRALERADALARTLMSQREFDSARRAYEVLMKEFPHTTLGPLVRERIEGVGREQDAFATGRAVTTDRLLAEAQSAANDGDFARAFASYDKFRELTLSKEAAAEAARETGFLRREEAAYDARMAEAREHEARGRYPEATAGYLAARRASERLFRHDRVTLPVWVESRPAGADVLLDGTVVGRTPTLVRRRCGEPFDLVLRADGYCDGSVSLGANSIDAFARAALTPTRASAWTLQGEGAAAAPGAAEPCAYVVRPEGLLQAVDLGTGRKLWERKLDGPSGMFASAPTAMGGRLLLAGVDGSLRAYERETGEELWRQPGDGLVAGRPVYLTTENRALVVRLGGTAAWIDLADGRPVRTARLPRLVMGAPLLFGNTLCFGADDGSVYAFDLKTETTLWRFTSGRRLTQPMCASANAMYVPLDDREIVAMALRDGKPLWRFDGSGEHLTAPATDGRRVFVASREGWLTALDAASGRVLWRTSLDGEVNVAPASDGDCVYVGTAEGTLSALSSADGSLVWKTTLAGPPASPPMPAQGHILVTTQAGTVQAFGR